MAAQTTTLDISYRNIGAVLGAVLGLAAIGILYLVTANPAVESVLLVRAVLSAKPSEAVQPAMVAVPAVSAAVGGWWLAPRALVRDRWSGIVMGAATYGVATLLGPFVALLGEPTIDPFKLLAGTISVALIAAVALFPLLPVCSLFGVGWAAVLRSAIGVRPDRSARPRRFSGRLIVFAYAALGLLWAGLMLWVGDLFPAGAWVD